MTQALLGTSDQLVPNLASKSIILPNLASKSILTEKSHQNFVPR
jgi:hypothetical protein